MKFNSFKHNLFARNDHKKILVDDTFYYTNDDNEQNTKMIKDDSKLDMSCFIDQTGLYSLKDMQQETQLG